MSPVIPASANDSDAPALTVDQAATLISNAVYEACGLYEQLQHAGRVGGNGHHVRQKIANAATALMRERWIEKTSS